MSNRNWKGELKEILNDFSRMTGTIQSLEIYQSAVRDLDWIGLDLVKENVKLAHNTLEVMLHSARLHQTIMRMKEKDDEVV